MSRRRRTLNALYHNGTVPDVIRRETLTLEAFEQRHGRVDAVQRWEGSLFHVVYNDTQRTMRFVIEPPRNDPYCGERGPQLADAR